VSSAEERPGNLDEVRESIDSADREIVRLLAESEGYVRRAAWFKEKRGDVEASKRVEEVIRRVRLLAGEHGATPEVVEEVYRTVISRFIVLEMEEQKE